MVSVRARNFISSDSLRGYALFHLPAVTGTQELVAHLVRPRSASLFGEWIAWLTGRYPELIDPKILASGKENYCEFKLIYLIKLSTPTVIKLSNCLKIINIMWLKYYNRKKNYNGFNFLLLTSTAFKSLHQRLKKRVE